MAGDSVLSDARIALRSLSRSPGLVLAAIFSLALGIGAAASGFSVVESVRFRALPFPDGERLILISEAQTRPGNGRPSVTEGCGASCVVSYATWSTILEPRRFRTLDRTAAHTSGAKALMQGGDAVLVVGTVASPGLFSLLDARPARGRLISHEDNRLGAVPVTLLSHQMWTTQFGGDDGVLGSTIRLSDTRYTVVGIMPPGFEFESAARFWIPMVPTLDPTTRPSIRSVVVVGRLAPGATIEQLRAELAGIEPEQPTGSDGTVLRLAADPLRTRYTQATQGSDLAFAAIVACVLLIACANFGNLLLVRAVDQQREMAVRAALGASPARLARHVIIQHGILVVAGSVLGLVLAHYLLGVLRVVSALNSFRPDGLDYRINLPVVLFAAGVAITVALAVSVLPVRMFSAASSHTELREGGSSRGGHTGRMQRSFVVAQIASAVLLLVVAGLQLKTLGRLSRVPLGFDASHVVLGTPSYPHDWRVKERFIPATERILASLRGLSGVTQVAVRAQLPVGSGRTPARLRLDGRAAGLPDPSAPQSTVAVSPEYFSALEIPLRQGRSFTEADREGAVRVAIINEWAAAHWWPGQSPIGQPLRLETPLFPDAALTVVGVVRDNRAAQSNLLLAEDGAELYVPYHQTPSAFPTFLLRVNGDPASIIRPLRALLVQQVPDRPVFTEVGEERADQQLAGIRTTATQMLLFAAAGLLLALIGVFGVLAYAVSRRIRELGIRRALGASDRGIQGLVLGEALQLAAIGFGVGGAAAWGASRLFHAMLHGTNPLDPVVYGAIALVVILTTALAALVPAVRASRVSPLRALRES